MKKEKVFLNPISIYIQNWQVKPVFFLGPVILLALFFQSCEEPIEVTGDLVPGAGNTELRFVELPLDVTQAAFDTVLVSSNNVTNSEGRIYFGQYNDPQIGNVKANGYFASILQEGFVRDSVKQDAIVKSVNFYMNFNYFYGDNFSNEQTFKISQLSDTLSNKTYTINDAIPAETEVGQSNILIEPSDTLTVSMQIASSIGEKMLSNIRNESYSDAEVGLALKGFKIESLESTDAIQGLNLGRSASYIEVVYENPGADTISSVRFNLSGSSFTEIEFETGSLIPSDYSGKKSFDLTDPSKIYFNNMIGIFPRINFRPFIEFIDTVDYMLINKAELVIANPDFELVNTRSTQKRPPEFIVPFILDEEGNIDREGGFFRAVQRNFTSQGAVADQESTDSPASLLYNDEKKIINADISFFLQEIYDNPGFWNPEYTVLPMSRIINRNANPFDETPLLQIGNFDNFLVDKSQIKMKVYYTTFK